MKWKFSRAIALLAILALVVAACGGDDEGSDTTEAETTDTTEAETTDTTEEMTDGGDEMAEGMFGLPVIEPIDVDPSVTLDIAGSSTVFPLSQAVLSQWEFDGGPSYELRSIGSGGGFEQFCDAAVTDISNASRPIDDEGSSTEPSEVELCQGNGRDPIEIRVGTDALSLVISPGNTFATELTFEEIATAFSLADSGATWADVNPDFPAHPIVLYSPGADSGTFDFFFETIYPDEYDAEETPPILESIANIVGEDDNVTVEGVAEDGCTEGDTSTPCAIGYFGYAYFAQNQDRLVAVAVDGGDGPVLPSADSVNENTYPISRPLFMYTAASVIEEKPQVAEFIAYYLQVVNDILESGEVQYFPAPDEALQEAADNISAAAGW